MMVSSLRTVRSFPGDNPSLMGSSVCSVPPAHRLWLSSDRGCNSTYCWSVCHGTLFPGCHTSVVSREGERHMAPVPGQ